MYDINGFIINIRNLLIRYLVIINDVLLFVIIFELEFI